MAEFYNTGFHGKSLFSSIKSGTKYIEHFLSGFAGYGWKLYKTLAGLWRLEVDELFVRGSMTVYELLISKLRALKGSLVISQANGKIKGVTSDDDYYYIVLEEDDMSFEAHDLIRCQSFNGTNIKSYWVENYASENGTITIAKSEFSSESGIPEIGDELVQLGNTVNTARQSALYLHADENGVPAMDILEGINSKTFDGCAIVRLGGILPGTDNARGLWCKNGKIFCTVNDNIVYEFNPDGSLQLGNGKISYNPTTDELVFGTGVKLTWDNLSEDAKTNLKGETGAADTVDSITEYYGLSTTSDTQPTTWSTTIPTMTVTNKYLWNYETVVYSKSGSHSTSPLVIGVYGTTGNGISSITNYYLASALSTGITASTSGWSTSVSTQTISETTPYLWNYEVITYTSGSNTATTPHIIGHFGADGDNGHTFKWMFYASDSYEQAPEFGQGLVVNPNDDPGANNKWSYTPSTSTTFIYIWMIQAEFDGSGVIVKKADNTYWTAPVCITGSDGQNGTDGTDVEFVYQSSTSATAPTTPTSVNTDGNIPTGWTDHPTGVTSASMYEYVCVRYKKNGTWGIYSTPVLWAKWGEKGQDGDGFEYVYKGTAINTSPSTPVATGTEDDEVPTGWTDNPTGVTSILPYEWVSVRKKTNGTWGTFSAPAVWAKYGADGTNGTNGTNGAAGVDGSDGTDGTSIVWKGDFSVHPSSPSDGWAYRNTTDKKSYVYQDGTWYQMTIDGAAGANGTNGTDGLSIVWKGDLSSAPASPVKNWAYRDTDNGLVYIYTGTAWALMVTDGSNGADGTNGTDGLSVFITYNASATEPAVPTGNGTLNGWHTSATSSDVWMSQKVAASSTSGTWGSPIKIKGDTGASGADGTDANLLPWVQDWDTNATLIDGTKVVSPKAFFGTKNETTGKLTGFGMGTGVIETGKSDIIGVNEGEVMTRLSAETGKFEAKDANISGTINATNGTFSGLIRNTTHTRLFSVNEAVTSGFYYLTGDDDFNLTVGSSYSEGSTLCLPTGKAYDGVKCTIVNSGVYDANDDFQGYNIKVMVKNSEVEGQKSFYANSLASGNQILEIRLLSVSVLHLWAFWRKDLALTDGGELIWIIENPNDFNAALYDATNYYLTSKSGQWE